MSGRSRTLSTTGRVPCVLAATGCILPEARTKRGIAEDLAQEVMLIVYRKAGQLRDHKLFHAWLFKVACHATCRYFAQRTREVPSVDVADIGDSLPAPNQSPFEPTEEFKDWMKFLDAQERGTMTLRFIPLARMMNSNQRLTPEVFSRGLCVPLGPRCQLIASMLFPFYRVRVTKIGQ